MIAVDLCINQVHLKWTLKSAKMSFQNATFPSILQKIPILSRHAVAEPAPEFYGGKCGARTFSGGGAKVTNARKAHRKICAF